MPFQDFRTGEEERKGTVIFCKSAITAFVNGDDESVFIYVRKVVLFEGFVENKE